MQAKIMALKQFVQSYPPGAKREEVERVVKKYEESLSLYEEKIGKLKANQPEQPEQEEK